MITRTSRPIASRHAQGGAALVVSMLLLLVLTLLAISGMNTASLELSMAGNVQYHENAFRAAETGIEQAMVLGMFDPSDPPQRLPETDGETTPVGDAGDHFFAMIVPELGGAPQPAMWGASWDSFSTYHFRLDSTGGSARNAVSTAVQGVAVIAPWDSTVRPGPGMPGSLTAP